MTIKQTYQDKVEGQLDELNSRIKQLAAKADDATADMKDKYQAEVKELKEQRNKTQAKLQELEDSGDEAFDDLKRGVDQALGSLHSAVDDATARFQNGSSS